MKIDGTGKQMLYRGDINGFTIIDDWIGFSIWGDNYNIMNMRVKTDGSMDEVTS